MRTTLLVVCLLGFVLLLALFSPLHSNPSMNGATPGCGPAGTCHTFQSGILSVTQPGNLQVRITLSGLTSGNVAGELVDSTGTVVAVNNQTSSNPFTLTAPRAGRYTVNAGYKNPQRRWDSTRVVLTLTGVGDEGRGAPGTHFRLEQNYPNPFNPNTVIRYELPERAQVTLTIFDARGRVVERLVHDFQPAGRYAAHWDGRGFAAGVYFYELWAGAFLETKKLLLLR